MATAIHRLWAAAAADVIVAELGRPLALKLFRRLLALPGATRSGRETLRRIVDVIEREA